MKTNSIKIILFILVGVFAVNSQTSTYSADDYHSFVKRMSEAGDNKARVEFVATELRKLNIRVSTEGFHQQGRGDRIIEGTNVIAHIPAKNAKKTIMLGAHIDKVSVGTGALDNASGTSAIIALLKAFKAAPLENYNLQFGFWDQEEVGLVGSRVYVANRKEKQNELPDIYINFDIFGHGDSLWLWSKDNEKDFVKNFISIAGQNKFDHIVTSDYPGSDHRSFAAADIESYSFSLLPKGEPANIIKLVTGQKVEEKDFPKAMRTMHTENDVIDVIDAKAVVKSLPVIEAAIRSLDK